MASGGQEFPPQKQETQPGKEHAMNPTPQATNEEYKPANKLQVSTLGVVNLSFFIKHTKFIIFEF